MYKRQVLGESENIGFDGRTIGITEGEQYEEIAKEKHGQVYYGCDLVDEIWDCLLYTSFFLSKPYLSKYIKEKSGMTFGDILKNVRMKKACTMLREGNATVESIAETVGYQNVEHFNRIFKKMYQVTPVQFRNQK